MPLPPLHTMLQWTYYCIQSAILAALLARAIHSLMFQPRLRLIANTLRAMQPDMWHFFLLFASTAVMVAAVMVPLIGYRYGELMPTPVACFAGCSLVS